MKFLVFGSLNIDMIFVVDHIVKKGETISSSAVRKSGGGKGANQAAALGKAGVPVFFAGKIGPDGQWILDMLKSFGVNTDKTIVSADIQTGQAIIQLDVNSQNSIILNAGGNKQFSDTEIESVFSGFEEGDVLVIQNEINSIDKIINCAENTGMTICFNPSPFEETIRNLPLDLVDYFFVNEIEARQMVRTNSEPETDSDFRKLAETLVAQFPDAGIVLTVGKKGAYYADKNGVCYEPIVEAPVIDTTGAGDTFTGYFLAALYDKKDPGEALVIASEASAVAVSRPGAMMAMPFRKELGI